MSIADVLLLAIRWLHGLAAVAWVGGGLFYLLVLRPSLNASSDSSGSTLSGVGVQFRNLVNTAIAVLMVTGVILTVTRLTAGHGGLPYVVVLSIKIVLSLYMFYLVRFLRPRTYPADQASGAKGLQRVTTLFTGATAVLVLGVIVFLLADILRAVVEKGIEG